MFKRSKNEDASDRSQRTVNQFVILILLAGVFSAATVATVVLAAGHLKQDGVVQLEILLPLLLLAGVTALVSALAILVCAFHLFDLTDRGKPFGVPEGTLQAVIALTLIMIFAITSLYLRGTFEQEVISAPGLSATQVEDIPATEILGVKKSDDGTFVVQRRVAVDQDAKDFSNQLLTILGTLVGAVAGFYFGAKSVETGVTAGGGSVPPTNTSPPVIGGTPLVGETLRAEAGGWTGSPAPSYNHQWQRKALPEPESQWRDIQGAATPTYLLVPDDAAKTVRVAITATNTAGKQTAYSAHTGEIGQTPTATIAPQIDGQPREGSELTAHAGEWAASPIPTYSYQWERSTGDPDRWEPIQQALAAAYRVQRDDVGKRLHVNVTANNTVGAGVTPSAPTEPITGAPDNSTPPFVSGDPRQGETLYGDPGTWSGWPLPFRFQWERSTPAVHAWTPITNATRSDYTLTRDDVGNSIRVTVAVETESASSAATEPVQGPPESTSPPSIHGEARVGEALTANIGDWTGTALTLDPRWQRQPPGSSGWIDIPDATSDTYLVAPEDIGAQLRLSVTASNPLGRLTKESEPTASVQSDNEQEGAVGRTE